jgi:hypothetical protein
MFSEYLYNLYNLYKSELSDLYTLYTSPPEIGLNTRLSSPYRARKAAPFAALRLTLKQLISGSLAVGNGCRPTRAVKGIGKGKISEIRVGGPPRRGTPAAIRFQTYGPILNTKIWRFPHGK